MSQPAHKFDTYTWYKIDLEILLQPSQWVTPVLIKVVDNHCHHQYGCVTHDCRQENFASPCEPEQQRVL